LHEERSESFLIGGEEGLFLVVKTLDAVESGRRSGQELDKIRRMPGLIERSFQQAFPGLFR
jgi:hypothetical protein